MVTLQVRRMVTKGRRAVPKSLIDEICKSALKVFHEQNLKSIEDYQQNDIQSNDFIVKLKRYDSYHRSGVDVKALIERYGGEDPNLFFTPSNTSILTPDGRELTYLDFDEGEEGNGFGDKNIAVIGGIELSTSIDNSVYLIVHELGHAYYNLNHHGLDESGGNFRPDQNDPKCIMGAPYHLPARFCDTCLEKAQLVERHLAKSHP